MESALDFHSARALLEWQIDLGATEAIGDAPVDRYALADKLPKPQAVAAPEMAAPPVVQVTDPVAVARSSATAAQSLEGLKEAMASFDLCDLKKGARNLVFADGTPGASVMILGEAPDRDEDREGKPFVGAPGALLDKMLDAIGLSRETSAYLAAALPWRPPHNRPATDQDIAMMAPFLERHVALAAPKVLVVMGDTGCRALLGRSGIARLRGQWAEAWNIPVLPMFHPLALLRDPLRKREQWADLLALKARLKGPA